VTVTLSGRGFEGFDFAVNNQIASKSPSSTGQSVSNIQLSKELAVFQLIEAYRKKGHLVAKTNPIRERKDRNANLDLAIFGLSDKDLQDHLLPFSQDQEISSLSRFSR
jgi:2-oxoglutarate dehydrogenase E1 component